MVTLQPIDGQGCLHFWQGVFALLKLRIRPEDMLRLKIIFCSDQYTACYAAICQFAFSLRGELLRLLPCCYALSLKA